MTATTTTRTWNVTGRLGQSVLVVTTGGTKATAKAAARKAGLAGMKWGSGTASTTEVETGWAWVQERLATAVTVTV